MQYFTRFFIEYKIKAHRIISVSAHSYISTLAH